MQKKWQSSLRTFSQIWQSSLRRRCKKNGDHPLEKTCRKTENHHLENLAKSGDHPWEGDTEKMATIIRKI